MELTCAALILNHNGRALLPPLYQSLLNQRGLSAIVLIDNASTDDSIQLTQTLSDRIEVIKNSENLDFGTAYNRAIATRSEDVILILNNDTIVHRDAVYRALLFLEQNPEVGSVSLEGLDPTHKAGFPVYSKPLRRFGKILCQERRYSGPEDGAILADYFLWGAACCVRRPVFESVRFDEDMDWYFEDVDLGWSIARTTGFRNVFLPSSTIYHLESTTSKTRFQKKRLERMTARNAMIAFAKNGTWLDLLIAAPRMLYRLIDQPKKWELISLLLRKRRERAPSVPLKVLSGPLKLKIEGPLTFSSS